MPRVLAPAQVNPSIPRTFIPATVAQVGEAAALIENTNENIGLLSCRLLYKVDTCCVPPHVDCLAECIFSCGVDTGIEGIVDDHILLPNILATWRVSLPIGPYLPSLAGGP